MKTIKPNNQGELILIDDEDFERVNQYDWYVTLNNYAIPIQILSICTDNTAHLARYILNYYGEFLIDHKDRDIFNNQKENLRKATRSQNGANRPKSINNTSGYKGVSWVNRDKRWIAQIGVNGQAIHIGSFRNKEKAALAYNEAAIKYHGEFAVLNKIE